MKSVVITLENNKHSKKASKRCIESAKNFNIHVEELSACNADAINVFKLFESHNIPSRNFDDQWSRKDRSMGCFFSHYSAWALSEAINQPILILEHDAVFKQKIKLDNLKFKRLLNLGRPSYGKFKETEHNGIQPFFSNPQGYLKGAHAYIVSPKGATELIKSAKYHAGPADLYISKQNFKWIEEYYPWPIEVEDNFSTVQNISGIRAKHNITSDYEVI